MGHKWTKPGEARAFIERAMSTDTDNCILWPFSINRDTGYAMGKYNGSMGQLHRSICLKTNGDPPSPTHHAAHTCHVRACINRKHIAWQTPSENMLGKRENGTASNGGVGWKGKLTPEQVASIKAATGIKAAKLATQYGVTIKTIRNVWSGATFTSPPIDWAAASRRGLETKRRKAEQLAVTEQLVMGHGF